MSSMVVAMQGAIVMMSLLAALFFLRYWRLGRDPFFLWFTAAFVMFAFSRALLVLDVSASEHAAPIYALRLFGFVLILGAILTKNRRREP